MLDLERRCGERFNGEVLGTSGDTKALRGPVRESVLSQDLRRKDVNTNRTTPEGLLDCESSRKLATGRSRIKFHSLFSTVVHGQFRVCVREEWLWGVLSKGPVYKNVLFTIKESTSTTVGREEGGWFHYVNQTYYDKRVRGEV